MILLDKKASIFRLTKDGDSQKQGTVTMSIESTRQPLSQEKTQMWGGSYGKMFRIYFRTGVTIKDGDQITIGTDKYKVMSGGVDNRDDGFSVDYVGVTVQKI